MKAAVTAVTPTRKGLPDAATRFARALSAATSRRAVTSRGTTVVPAPQRLYLFPLLDTVARRIVGWQPEPFRQDC